MSEDRDQRWTKRPGRPCADDAVAADFSALCSATESGIPSTESSVRSAAARRARSLTESARATERGATSKGVSLMPALRFLKARPAFTAAFTVVAVSFIFLFVPFSYERTVGNDVTLTLAGAGLDGDAVRAIADDFKAAVGGSDVRVGRIATIHADHAASDAAHGAEVRTVVSAAVGEAPSPALAHPDRFRLTAFTPTRSQRDAQHAASLFASTLARRGIDSRAQVAPRRERVEGNMYAMAGEGVCQLTIDRRGKTAEELEADIRSQLSSCGMEGANVAVTTEGDMTQVQISCDTQCCLGDADALKDCQEECEIKLVVDGESGDDAKAIMIRPDPNMTQEEIQALIEQKLREQGIDAAANVQLERTQTADGEECRLQVKIEKEN